MLGRDRATYAGRKTLVVGAGHSAANTLIDLTRLLERDLRTSVVWVIRGANLARVYGGLGVTSFPPAVNSARMLRIWLKAAGSRW